MAAREFAGSWTAAQVAGSWGDVAGLVRWIEGRGGHVRSLELRDDGVVTIRGTVPGWAWEADPLGAGPGAGGGRGARPAQPAGSGGGTGALGFLLAVVGIVLFPAVVAGLNFVLAFLFP